MITNTSSGGSPSRLIIWDSAAEPPVNEGSVYCWNGYAETEAARSVLRYAENNGEHLRNKYLTWVHDLGEKMISGKRLVDHLAFEDGLSYWWMTLLVEKSFYKSPITDAIRLLALEEIVVRQKPRALRLVSANRRLHESISGMCQKLEIRYEWEKKSSGSRQRAISMKSIYRALPQPAQGLAALARYLWERWPLKGAEKSGWFNGTQSLFFCSYFDNVDPKAAAQGSFQSHYWGELLSLVRRAGYRGNWLQLYVPCASVPTMRVAQNWARGFNRSRETQGFHAFLGAYLSWHLVLRVIKRWFWLNRVAWRVRGIRQAFRPKDSCLSLWPLMRSDWNASLCGAAAIGHLLSLELFDAALRAIPRQKKGFYLSENQAWEKALIHAWRKHGHGRLIAVAHSTVRFWDLRYFTDPRTLRSADSYPMPRADLVALNGRAAVDAYRCADYPGEDIVECEALRYGHLNSLRSRRSPRKADRDPVRVLVLGDYLPSATIKMLQLLEAAAGHAPVPAIYTVKPHPNFTIEPSGYPSLHLKVVVEPLGKILRDFDVAYASSSTSASVDAYLAGLPVVVLADENELNFSPLRGQPGVRFVGAPRDLAEALCSEDRDTPSGSAGNDFFFLDPELPRWSRLLVS